MLNRILSIALTSVTGCAANLHSKPVMTAADKPAEGSLTPFMGKPQLDMQQVFTGERFPNVVVATDGYSPGYLGQKELQRASK